MSLGHNDLISSTACIEYTSKTTFVWKCHAFKWKNNLNKTPTRKIIFLAVTVKWFVLGAEDRMSGPMLIWWGCASAAAWVMIQHRWWRHQMETFCWPFVRGIHRSPASVNSAHTGQWRGALIFSLTCGWTNSQTVEQAMETAVILRRHCANYDVTVMWPCSYALACCTS